MCGVVRPVRWKDLYAETGVQRGITCGMIGQICHRDSKKEPDYLLPPGLRTTPPQAPTESYLKRDPYASMRNGKFPNDNSLRKIGIPDEILYKSELKSPIKMGSFDNHSPPASMKTSLKQQATKLEKLMPGEKVYATEIGFEGSRNLLSSQGDVLAATHPMHFIREKPCYQFDLYATNGY